MHKEAQVQVEKAAEDPDCKPEAMSKCVKLARLLEERKRWQGRAERKRKPPARYDDDPIAAEKKQKAAEEMKQKRERALRKDEMQLKERLTFIERAVTAQQTGEAALAFAETSIREWEEEITELKEELSSGEPKISFVTPELQRAGKCAKCKKPLEVGAQAVFWRGGKMTCKSPDCKLEAGEYTRPLSEKEKQIKIEKSGKKAEKRVREEMTKVKISAVANGTREMGARADGKTFKMDKKKLLAGFFSYQSLRFLAQTGELRNFDIFLDTSAEALRNAASLAKHRFAQQEWYQLHCCFGCRHGSIVADGCEKIWNKICKGFYAHLTTVDDTKVLDQLDFANACNNAVQRGNQHTKSSSLCSRCILRQDLVGEVRGGGA